MSCPGLPMAEALMVCPAPPSALSVYSVCVCALITTALQHVPSETVGDVAKTLLYEAVRGEWSGHPPSHSPLLNPFFDAAALLCFGESVIRRCPHAQVIRSKRGDMLIPIVIPRGAVCSCCLLALI